MANSFTMGDDEARAVIEEAALMKSQRLNWENYWQEVSEVVLPSFSNTFSNNISVTPGAKKDQKRFDGRAEVALYRFAAAMESMLTPRGGTWHSLATSDPSLNRKPRVRQYFDDVTDILFRQRYAPMANFASQCHEYYTSLGAFGTASMYVDKRDGGGYRYSTQHIANVYFADNHQGIVERAIRPFRLTARNAVAKFGANNVPAGILTAATGPNPNQLFDFFHCVKPNENRKVNYKDWRGAKFVSYYVSVLGHMTCLREGFNSFPYMISRYMTAPGELYGRSPAMQVLTNIKVLNEQKKTVLKQGQRVVDPVLLGHDDGVLDGFSLKPGSLNAGAINARGQRLVDVLPTGNLSVGFEMMEQEGKEISSAFLTDLFQILVEGSDRMTTTEVIERAREKGALLSPTMGRQESEFLGFLIDREIDLGVQQRFLPDMPPELVEAGGEYKIIYDNPLSRAQKAEQTAGAMRVIQWAAEFAQMTQNPEPLDHFDFDAIIPDLAMNQAVPFRYMATVEKLKAIRDGRAQQVATQQVIQAGPSVAALANSQGNKIQ